MRDYSGGCRAGKKQMEGMEIIFLTLTLANEHVFIGDDTGWAPRLISYFFSIIGTSRETHFSINNQCFNSLGRVVKTTPEKFQHMTIISANDIV